MWDETLWRPCLLVFRPSLLLTLVVFAPLVLGENLSSRVSKEMRTAISKAERAVEAEDYQLALALYEGALYSGGLKFAIDESTLSSESQQKAVYSALATWSKELQGDFPVYLTDEMGEADVILRFVDRISGEGSDSLGLIRILKNYSWNSSRHEVEYDGTIQIVRSAPGGELTHLEIQEVVMHEFGHLLGLRDQAEVGVVMGPLDRGNPLSKPSKAEVDSVRELRSMLRERIEAVLSLVSDSNEG